jgi:hypothetical protein
MQSLCTYVGGLCAASPESAATLIGAAGMKVAALGMRSKPILAAKLGVPAGTVLLEANAGLLSKTRGRKCFNWAYTLDGKIFVALPSTPKAKTSVAGLPLLALVGFRVSVTDKNGDGPWSQVVSILVH